MGGTFLALAPGFDLGDATAFAFSLSLLWVEGRRGMGGMLTAWDIMIGADEVDESILLADVILTEGFLGALGGLVSRSRGLLLVEGTPRSSNINSSSSYDMSSKSEGRNQLCSQANKSIKQPTVGGRAEVCFGSSCTRSDFRKHSGRSSHTGCRRGSNAASAGEGALECADGPRAAAIV